MVVRLIFIAVLFTAFTAGQAQVNPLYPYGPYYGYPYPMPYGMAPYPYGVPYLRHYNMAGVPTTGYVPYYHNVPGIGTVNTGMMQRRFQEFMRPMSNMNAAKAANHDVANMAPRNAVHHETRAEDGGPQMRSTFYQQHSNGRDSVSESHEPRENNAEKYSKPVQNDKEIIGNQLEFEDEYEQKRERDTEWDQSDYDNIEWEDTNDIDAINVYNNLPKKSIDIKGDTYVNDLLAAKGAALNPDAEFIPPRKHNNEREELEYEDLAIHPKQRLHYHGDTRVNEILAARNSPINPDAEFIPPSSKYSTPIEVHYGYDIDDDDDNNKPIDLTHNTEVEYKDSFSRNRGEYSGDTVVNEILKKQGAPMNPDAEMINSPNKELSKPKQEGQYSGDTYVNEVLADRGTATNPDAEIFNPDEQVIEFVPLENEKFDFERDLRGDTYINRIAEIRGVRKNPYAEEFDPNAARRSR